MSSFPPPAAAARSSSSSTSSSIIIVIIIIASAIIVSVCIYLLLQLLSRKFHRSFRTHSDVVLFSDHHHHSDSSNNNNHNNNNNDDDQLLLLTSLPLFTFSSLGNLTTADCAVCLSKFHPHDQLRLLPLCCHAFHSDCIDSWILSNRTCPLCRSLAFPSEADVLDKIRNNNTTNGNSFRIEIGSVSQRRIVNTEEEEQVEEEEEESNSRSYSIGGSFEYIVDENEYEVSVGSVSRQMGDKEPSARGVQPPGEDLAAEVAGGGSGRNWLRDYIDRASSSFRGSSGRFFTGSSRRNDTDLEANQRAGEEITEYFRWFSGY